MSKRKYTHVQELLPEIQEMIAGGKTQREVAETPKPMSPKTGDDSQLLMWSLISMISLAAIFAVSLLKKKHKN